MAGRVEEQNFGAAKPRHGELVAQRKYVTQIIVERYFAHDGTRLGIKCYEGARRASDVDLAVGAIVSDPARGVAHGEPLKQRRRCNVDAEHGASAARDDVDATCFPFDHAPEFVARICDDGANGVRRQIRQEHASAVGVGGDGRGPVACDEKRASADRICDRGAGNRAAEKLSVSWLRSGAWDDLLAGDVRAAADRHETDEGKNRSMEHDGNLSPLEYEMRTSSSKRCAFGGRRASPWVAGGNANHFGLRPMPLARARRAHARSYPARRRYVCRNDDSPIMVGTTSACPEPIREPNAHLALLRQILAMTDHDRQFIAGRPHNLRVTRRAFGPPAPARLSELVPQKGMAARPRLFGSAASQFRLFGQ